MLLILLPHRDGLLRRLPSDHGRDEVDLAAEVVVLVAAEAEAAEAAAGNISTFSWFFLSPDYKYST